MLGFLSLPELISQFFTGTDRTATIPHEEQTMLPFSSHRIREKIPQDVQNSPIDIFFLNSVRDQKMFNFFLLKLTNIPKNITKKN
jgi:hypothetical protein